MPRGLRGCIVDLDLQHGKSALQILRPTFYAVSGRELGFHVTIDDDCIPARW